MPKGQNWWLLSHHHYELTEFDGIEVYRFCILELLKSCHEIETRIESFLELCGKVVKMRLGSFMELQLGNVFRLIKVWNFLCVFIVYELLETNLNFFTRSTINLLFLDWGTGLKSAYIKVSVVFRKYIQTRKCFEMRLET